MIITFCGHAQFCKSNEYEKRVLDFLQEKVGDESAEVFLGGYGGFDKFAYDCCKKYKDTHSKVTLVFVSPYLTIDYQKNHLEFIKDKYDYILYPEIEGKPKKFAIIYRNEYMIDKADYVIAYVAHDWGGAYRAYKYAKRKGKNIFNLAEFE